MSLDGDAATMTATMPPSGKPGHARAQITAKTYRKDRWWLGPLLTTLGLAVFIVYATGRVFQQDHYWVGAHHYLTPFYSPCLALQCEPASALFGRLPFEFPWFLPYAAVSLPFLLLFRFTCYYYRKAYYRSIWQAPTACAVAEPHSSYTGESRWPMILQNLHRYAFYIAVLISVVNTIDAIIPLFHGTDGGFGLGVGNLVLITNVVLLWAYTASCHSCRHAFGGRLKSFGAKPVQYWMWTQISRLNTRHMLFAWITLASLMLTDLYVALVSSGTVTDLRIFN